MTEQQSLFLKTLGERLANPPLYGRSPAASILPALHIINDDWSYRLRYPQSFQWYAKWRQWMKEDHG